MLLLLSGGAKLELGSILMPYIAIKGFPKDEETIRKVADRFNEALLEL